MLVTLASDSDGWDLVRGEISGVPKTFISPYIVLSFPERCRQMCFGVCFATSTNSRPRAQPHTAQPHVELCTSRIFISKQIPN